MFSFFHGDGGKVRRRMGQTARKKEPVSKSRPSRPTAILAYDEPASTVLRGRALPRWRRRMRITLWKAFRPLARLHRRVPAGLLVLFYLIVLAGVSAVFLLNVLPEKTARVAAPKGTAGQPATLQLQSPGPGGNLLGGMAPQPQPFLLKPDTKKITDMVEQLGDIEFRAGRYPSAEKLYRAAFRTSPHRALTGFQIYVCTLLQGRHGQAADLKQRLARIGAKTPAHPYARAVLAFTEGRNADAEKILAEARTTYGSACDAYDPILTQLGYPAAP